MPDNQQPTLTLEFEVHFPHDGDRRRAKPGRKPAPRPEEPSVPQKLPRVVRMLALAHHLDDLLQKGVFKDYADIARISGLSRARITQIMNLLYLAPQVQENLLNPLHPPHLVTEKSALEVAKNAEWDHQCTQWNSLKTGC
jgi:hypothetical protein